MSGIGRAVRYLVDEVAEWLVLAAVLGIAAIASYLHLRDVWRHAGAPIPDLGPLLVDGLFAAAWLRMRRRRREDTPVGALAWFALVLALVATVAGNIAAAVIAGHTSALAIAVAAWPALAFALVWELVTGHARPAPAQEGAEPARNAAMDAGVGVSPPPETPTAPEAAPAPEPVTEKPAPDRAPETADERRRRAQRDRAARARRHKTGDHTACDPTRCPDAPRLHAVAGS